MNNFDILEIPQGSGEKAVKKAYRSLVKIHHPDKGGDKNIFKK